MGLLRPLPPSLGRRVFCFAFDCAASFSFATPGFDRGCGCALPLTGSLLVGDDGGVRPEPHALGCVTAGARGGDLSAASTLGGGLCLAGETSASLV